jgi:hypothetical protein
MALLITDSRRMAVARLEQIDDDGPTWLGTHDRPVRRARGHRRKAGRRLRGCDSGNHRIVGFDAIDGSGWDTLGSQGAAWVASSGRARSPSTPRGRIYVADTGNHRIVRVDDLSGAGSRAYGSAGAPSAADPGAVGCFDSPRGIDVDGLGRVAVADPKPGRVVRFDALDGSGWIASAGPPGPRSPVDVAATDGSNLS